MQYLRGWRALMNDPERWKKLGMASLLMLSTMIPVLGQAVLAGWHSLALRRAVQGQDKLPELSFDFDYLGKLFMIGIKPFLAQLLWSIPMMLGIIPGVFGGAMGGAFLAREDPGMFPIVMIASMALMYGTMILFSMPMQIAVMRAGLMDDLGQAVGFKPVLKMSRMLLKELIVGYMVLIPLSIFLMMFGMALCYVGMFVTISIAQIIGTYWHAELYARYLQKGGEPLAIGPLDVPATAKAAPSI